jgi:hypothetical protein
MNAINYGLLFAGILLSPLVVFAQSSDGAPSAAEAAAREKSAADLQATQKANTRRLYFNWSAEKDPRKQKAEAENLLQSAVLSDDEEVVREIFRGGPHAGQELPLPTSTRFVALKMLFTLPVSEAIDNACRYSHEGTPIFRRLTKDRFEAWTSTNGWLFDAGGRLLHHVRVPRRDGTGSEWFGAFLPSGRWITTDLWNDDRQLNAFTPQAKWLWELRGKKLAPESAEDEEPIIWARSDKMGDGWIACLTFNDLVYVWISPEGHFRNLSNNDPWLLTYPRAMQAKGTYLELSIPSDNNKLKLTQDSAGHGNWIDFPTYRMDRWQENNVIPDGDVYFGFWPRSARTWVETNSAEPDIGKTGDTKVWFIDPSGRYEAEIAASWLGDSADHKSLLLQDVAHRVIRVGPNWQLEAQEFQIHSETLQPLTLFDDLRVGFFFDPATKAVVLAGW